MDFEPLDQPDWYYMQHRIEALSKLGRPIRERRKALEFSQEKFAHYAGVDRSYMGAVERGERNVTFGILCDLSLALDCDLGALLSG